MTDTIEDRANDIYGEMNDKRTHRESALVLLEALQAERADMREKAATHVGRRGTTRSGWVQNVEKVDVLAQEIRNLD